MGNVSKIPQPDHRNRQQQKVPNRSSMQREITAPGGCLKLAPKNKTYKGQRLLTWARRKNAAG